MTSSTWRCFLYSVQLKWIIKMHFGSIFEIISCIIS
uniref:Uncharacterized protein n=1 Tax=Rhizophora mucronata TaxID=61149 RepID=A0A2P2M9Y8_RHIMU